MTSAATPEYSRVSRYMISTSQKGEQYVVCDTYESMQSDNNTPIRVYTHVFNSVDDAREGFFYLLWGAERLQNRDEGAMVVGEVSYGRENYCCFLRNNIAIRVVSLSRECAGIPKTFVERIDQHIIEQSK